MKKEWLRACFCIASIFFILILFFKYEGSITGFAIYGSDTKEKEWAFDAPSEYIYNNSLITLTDGKAQLAASTVVTYWNTTTETEYTLQKALYYQVNKDKTSKINELDNTTFELEEGTIFDVFFPQNLDNGNSIFLYLKEGEERNIYLCDKGTLCSSPGYGLVQYDGEEGWYNITLSSLDEATKIVNLIVSGQTEIDHITSTAGDVTKALHNPSDITEKVKSLDNLNEQIKKDEILDIIFDNIIQNKDIISLYITSGDPSDIFLCDYGDQCSSPGYGLIYYDGGEGWYNITLSNLPSPTTSFNLDPTKVKIDYIKAAAVQITQHNSSNTTYPSSAEIQTNDFQPEGWTSWEKFSTIDHQNNQNLTYYYSTDGGNSWGAILQNSNLSSVNSSKIRFKAFLSSDSTGTPSLDTLTVTYLQQYCIENWTEQYDVCQSNDTRVKYYTDLHSCGTTADLPEDNGTMVSCNNTENSSTSEPAESSESSGSGSSSSGGGGGSSSGGGSGSGGSGGSSTTGNSKTTNSAIKTLETENTKTTTKAAEKGITAQQSSSTNKLPGETCDYGLEVVLPSEHSFADTSIIEGKITNQGNCDIPLIKMQFDNDLIKELSFESPLVYNIIKGDTKTFFIQEKQQETSNSANRFTSRLTSAAIIRVPSTKTITGNMIVSGFAENKEPVLNKEIPLKITTVTVDPTINKGILYLISSIIIVIISVVVIIRKRSSTFEKKPKL